MGVSTRRADGGEKRGQRKAMPSRWLMETKTLQSLLPPAPTSPCDLFQNRKLPEQSISQTDRQRFVVRADLWFFNPHFGLVYIHGHFLRYELRRS